MSEHRTELKTLMAEWGRACGGEQLQRLGYAALERVGAPEPASDASADVWRVHRAVEALRAIGRWKEARVIAAEYLMPNAHEQARLAALQRMGLTMSRASYYTHLNAAHLFVAGALSVDTHPALAESA